MAQEILFAFVAFLSVIGVARGDLLVVPQNTAVFEGASQVILECSVVDDITYRMQWTEYVTNPDGIIFSDGRAILGSHPNRARYSIVGDDEMTYNLRIENVTLADAGRYKCQQMNAEAPAVYRGFAELSVLASDPHCQEFFTISGAAVEGRYYTNECEVTYGGAFTPNMTWSGPGVFDVSNSVTDSEVWSMSSFIAERNLEGGRFSCLTTLKPPEEFPEDSATNVPDYSNTFTGRVLEITWPPMEIGAIPIKEIYQVGETITCFADAKPAAAFRWTNQDTLVSQPVGAVFTITADLQGRTQRMRCTATNFMDGAIHTQDFILNVTVPAATTPTQPTTPTVPTTPLPDGPCHDLTGHWSSTNPNAHICLEVDFRGNILALIQTGSDVFFVAGNGKTVFGDYRHVGVTGVWPAGLGGVGGFTGECHNCNGVEVILFSGLQRNKAVAPGCGLTAGTDLTQLYVMRRFGGPCRNPEFKVYRPTADHIKYFQIREENILR